MDRLIWTSSKNNCEKERDEMMMFIIFFVFMGNYERKCGQRVSL